jgi:UDP-N-acetylglucosamine 2-epimerase/N-acetylmannosamine kinase
MKTVCVVITARPSYSRIKSVLQSIHKDHRLKLSIIVTASALLDRYGNVSEEILADGFEIDSQVYTVLEGASPASMAKTTGIAIIELTTEFQRLKPDLVVTIADRFETIGTAIAATYSGIPLVHIQGGEITGSIDERVRHSITKLADFHVACTAKAASNIIRMGENPSTVFNTGCPSIDLAASICSSDRLSFDFYSIYQGVGNPIDLKSEFVIALLHPVTTEFQLAEEQATTLLRALSDEEKHVIWFWPNVDAGSDGTSRALRKFREINPNAPFYFVKNVSPSHFLELLSHSQFIIGNSSVAIRECSFLGVPAVNIGSRQQYRERGRNVIDCDWDYFQLKTCLKQIQSPRFREKSMLYGDGKSGKRISDLLATLEFNRLPLQKVLMTESH